MTNPTTPPLGTCDEPTHAREVFGGLHPKWPHCKHWTPTTPEAEEPEEKLRLSDRLYSAVRERLDLATGLLDHAVEAKTSSRGRTSPGTGATGPLEGCRSQQQNPTISRRPPLRTSPERADAAEAELAQVREQLAWVKGCGHEANVVWIKTEKENDALRSRNEKLEAALRGFVTAVYPPNQPVLSSDEILLFADQFRDALTADDQEDK